MPLTGIYGVIIDMAMLKRTCISNMLHNGNMIPEAGAS
jgi:hypothetical protein